MRKIFVYFVLFVVSHLSAEAAEIRLRGDAECRGGVVRLADVADIVAPETTDADLARVVLFPAPPEGTPREVSRQEIRQLLVLSGVDLSSCQFVGSEFVTVRKAETAIAVRAIPIRTERAQTTAVKPVSFEKPAKAERAKPAVLLVERGSGVTVHSLAAGIKVTTYGKALEGGAAGESILVELADKQKIQARVVGPQLVEVGQPNEPKTAR